MLLDKILRKEVAQKYKLITIRADKYNFPDYGYIDLRQINVKKADELFNKGFPFLKLLTQIDKLETNNNPLPDNYAPVSAAPAASTSENDNLPIININVLRKHKQYINNLLTRNWSDLPYNDKLVFNNDETYFLNKKRIMLLNGDINKSMISLHAKLKAVDPDPKYNDNRKSIITELAALDDEKAANWIVIDTWIEKVTSKQNDNETEVERAVRKSKELAKKITANEIYIYRAIKSIPDMPRDTEKQKAKIIKKQNEVEKRKLELEELGHPYKY